MRPAGLFRRGIVREMDGSTARGRVWLEEERILTDWLPVVVPFALNAHAHAYALPRVGCQVVLLMDEHVEDGSVLGAIYSQADPPPVTDPLVVHMDFEDGTVLEYNPTTHLLKAHVSGNVEVVATGTITLRAPTIVLDGQVSVLGGLDVQGDITCTGTNPAHHTHPVSGSVALSA